MEQKIPQMQMFGPEGRIFTDHSLPLWAVSIVRGVRAFRGELSVISKHEGHDLKILLSAQAAYGHHPVHMKDKLNVIIWLESACWDYVVGPGPSKDALN
jgi:hypothetical protein